jgi:Flp pilus assembly pilin Flp
MPFPKRFQRLGRLFRRLHRDERGVLTLETVLIIAAIALPVLIVIIKYGWPAIRSYFDRGLQSLEQNTDDVTR